MPTPIPPHPPPKKKFSERKGTRLSRISYPPLATAGYLKRTTYHTYFKSQ